jgi:AcrR family transcriptional regulator
MTQAPVAGKAPQILAEFTRSVAEHGYDGTNFAEVAAAVGVSKGLIAHHFGSKERLLAQVHEDYMRRRLDEQERLGELTTSPAEYLAALTYASAWWHVHDRYAAVAFQREIVRVASIADADEGRRLRERYVENFREIMRAGMAAGQFRAFDATLTSLFVSGAAQWMWTWYDPRGSYSPDEVGAAAVDLILGGLLTDAHRGDLSALADPHGDLARRVSAELASAATHPGEHA